MLVRANSSCNFRTEENTEFTISKNELRHIKYDKDKSNMYIANHNIHLSYEHFKSLFSFLLVEDHKVLHMKRFIDCDVSFEESINDFISDNNIKVKNIFEPDPSTVDIYYTKYIGDWN